MKMIFKEGEIYASNKWCWNRGEMQRHLKDQQPKSLSRRNFSKLKQKAGMDQIQSN